ncbi:MAG: hypothetical protein SFY80_11220 [Verrucomicrobiota bacterium]|nr:hypothetical protein [Verrucomicrobiota bacterium]
MKNITNHITRILSAGIILHCAGVSLAQAAIIIYDGIDYADSITGTTINTSVGGSNGGQGWTSPWVNGLENSATTGSVGVESPGLSYSTLQVTGNALSDPTSLSRGARREFDNTGLGVDDSSLWFSALYQHTSAGSDFRVKFFADSSLVLTSSGYATAVNSGIGFNYSGTSGLRVENQATQLGTGTVLTNNTAYFIVGRIDFKSGNDDVRLWVNPSLTGTPEDSSASQFQSTAIQSTIGNAVAVRWGGTSTGIIDEIRMGNSFVDVAPTTVPEPAYGAAIIAVVLGCMLVRRIRPKSY